MSKLKSQGKYQPRRHVPYKKKVTRTVLESAIARAKYAAKNNIDPTKGKDIIEDPSLIGQYLKETISSSKQFIDTLVFVDYLIKQGMVTSHKLAVDIVKLYRDYIALSKRVRLLDYVDDHDFFMVESLEISDLLSKQAEILYKEIIKIEPLNKTIFRLALLLATSIKTEEEVRDNPKKAYETVIRILSTNFIGENFATEGELK